MPIYICCEDGVLTCPQGCTVEVLMDLGFSVYAESTVKTIYDLLMAGF